MSLHDPFDPKHDLHGCSCGRHGSQSEHDAAAPADDIDALNRRVIQSTVVRALFPQDAERRRFLSAVGGSAALAAISTFFPFGALEAMAQDKGPLEKKDLKIGFIPITCASPLIMADPLGFYKQQGLNVSVVKTASWALIRDKVINKEHEASQMLAPMPLAISLGVGATALPISVATIQNVNGQAITLHVKHKDKRDPKQWKGFKFAVPFEFSMHNFLLRYYVAEHGLDPDKDIQIRVVPPPEMVANLRAGNLDGYLAPDPFNQRAVFDEVGFIHILSREIWDGHPCCSFAAPAQFVVDNPNTFAALYRAVLTASAMASGPKNRALMAEVLSPANYLNQPKTVLEQVLTGKFADGLGGIKEVPERIDFEPYPWYSMAVWILSQMKRWGYLKGDVRYKDIAEKVYLLTDAKKRMTEVGLAVPKETYRKYKILGKEFDPAKPDAYVDSFAIKRS